MLNLPGSRRKRTRRTRLTILQSSSPRRQHEFREISNPSPHADAPNSQEHPFDLETSLQEASYASDQPEPSLSGLAANTDLESISRGVIRQSHLTRKQNEEENYQAFRPKALETFNKASCQQVLTDRYKGLSDYTKDFTQKCTQEAKCASCGLHARHSGEPTFTRAVCLVSVTCFIELQVPVYQCTRCPERPAFHADPLLCGAFPGSPVHAVDLLSGRLDRQRIWFAVELLDLLASLRKHNAHIATDGFTTALFEIHMKGCNASLASRDVARRQLGKAIEEYEVLQYNKERRISDICQDHNPVGCCPGCSTDSRQGESTEAPAQSESEVPIQCQLFGDGNFRLPHYTGAGKSTQHAPSLSNRILKDSDVEDFCSNPSSSVAAADSNPCNFDFNADKQLGRVKAQFDVTGIFAAFCRHGMLILALNMITGEKWSYATYILYCLLKQNVVPTVWWYDINCRYKGHFARWLEASDLSDRVKEAARSIQFPLPPWHHSMHNANCQSLNSYRRMEGVGSGVGEPPEQAWSHLGPYGYILQYHSLPSRQTYLEHIIAHWNADKMLGLPLALLKMYKRARQEHQAAIQTADGLLQYASSILQIPVQEVVQAVSQEAPLQVEAESPCPTWQGHYVALLLELDLMEKAESSRLSPRFVSGSLTGTIRLDRLTRKLKTQRQLLDYEGQHEIAERWKPGEADFEDGFLELCEHHMSLVQHRIATLVQEYLLLEELFGRVQNRRGDTKRLMKSKQRQKSKITTAAQQWLDWKSAIPGSEAEGQPSISTLLPSILRAEYPWHADFHEGAMEVLQSKITLQLDLISRNEEEMDLAKTEAVTAAANLGRQLQRIRRKLEEIALDEEDNLSHVPPDSEDELCQVDAEYAKDCELHRCQLDSLRGLKEQLTGKQKELQALAARLRTVQDEMALLCDSNDSEAEANELRAAIDAHVSSVVEDREENAEQDWLDVNRVMP